MGKQVRLIRKKRVYSHEFRQELVHLFERGQYSVAQLPRLYGVNFSLLYRWIYRYSTLNEKGCRIVEMKDSSTDKLKALEKKVKELERLVGQKQIQIEFLEKMIDLSGKETGLDLKKNFFTPPSGGSSNTKKR